MKDAFNNGEKPQALRESLFKAIAFGDKDGVRALLDSGADIHGVNSYGTSALFYACASRADIFSLMLERIPDPSAPRGRQGISLMHEAAAAGNVESIGVLIAAGMDASAPGPYAYTPLMHAAMDGHGDAVEALLAAGADPMMTARDGGFSVLHAAAIGGDRRAISCLATSAAVVFINATDRGGRAGQTPLELAVAFLHPGAVEELIRHGALVNFNGERNTTPLHHVLKLNGGERTVLEPEKSERVEIVRILLDAGADIFRNPVAPMDETALHLAACDAWTGDRICAMMLETQDGDIDVRNAAGETPLHHAARQGKPETVELLLRAGADVNARSKSGVTPLMLAASANMRRSVAALLAAGADTDAVSAGGMAADDMSGYDKVRELIKDARAARQGKKPVF